MEFVVNEFDTGKSPTTWECTLSALPLNPSFIEDSASETLPPPVEKSVVPNLLYNHLTLLTIEVSFEKMEELVSDEDTALTSFHAGGGSVIVT